MRMQDLTKFELECLEKGRSFSVRLIEDPYGEFCWRAEFIHEKCGTPNISHRAGCISAALDFVVPIAKDAVRRGRLD